MSHLFKFAIIPALAIGLTLVSGEQRAEAGGFSIRVGNFGFSSFDSYYRPYYRVPPYTVHRPPHRYHSYRPLPPRPPHHGWHRPPHHPHYGNHHGPGPGHYDNRHRGPGHNHSPVHKHHRRR